MSKAKSPKPASPSKAGATPSLDTLLKSAVLAEKLAAKAKKQARQAKAAWKKAKKSLRAAKKTARTARHAWKRARKTGGQVKPAKVAKPRRSSRASGVAARAEVGTSVASAA